MDVGKDIIAMGFPSMGFEGVYRNPLKEVKKFFNTKHKGKYKVYNLCAERWYEESKFDGGGVCHNYRFFDHEAPPFEIVHPYCMDMKRWLDNDPENICVVHCKAGKGRTGCMICCFLLFSGRCKTPEEALQYYGKRRTQDEKGVTIPSQKRYINYYFQYINNKYQVPFPLQTRLILRKVVLTTFKKKTTLNIKIDRFYKGKHDTIYNHKKFVGVEEIGTQMYKQQIVLNREVEDDVRFCIFKKEEKKRGSLGKVKYKKFIKCWFNTQFIENGYLRCVKSTSDWAAKKKSERFPFDWEMEFYFSNSKTKRRIDLVNPQMKVTRLNTFKRTVPNIQGDSDIEDSDPSSDEYDDDTDDDTMEEGIKKVKQAVAEVDSDDYDSDDDE